MNPVFDVRIARSRMLSPTVRELVLARVDGKSMVFAAGQHVSLAFGCPADEVQRSYSIASRPDGSPRFAVAIRTPTTGAEKIPLHTLPEGTMLRAHGPKGALTRRPLAGSPALFVGNGTGVAPLRSMIADAAAHGEKSPLVLLLGVRHASDRLYADELRALQGARSTFGVHYTLSQPHSDWAGLTGYVQQHIPRFFGELSQQGAPHVYLSGSVAMVGAARALLRSALNVPPEQIHGERND